MNLAKKRVQQRDIFKLHFGTYFMASVCIITYLLITTVTIRDVLIISGWGLTIAVHALVIRFKLTDIKVNVSEEYYRLKQSVMIGSSNDQEESLMNLQYEQEVAIHNKKDAIMALGFFVYFIIRDFVVSIGWSQFNISGEAHILEEWRLLIAITCFIDILIVLAIVKLRKQTLASIGLHKKNIWSAIGLGLLFAPIFIIVRATPGGMIDGWELRSFGSLGAFMLLLLNVTLWAVREDISFVGFIQTRLYGLVKNDFWAINLGATLFTLVHLPSRLVDGVPLDMTFFLLMINWFFMHRAFVLLFKRYFSLIPVFIMHVASNFPGLWQGGRAGAEWLWTVLPTVMFCVAVEIWYWRWSEGKTDKGENIYDEDN